MVQMDADYRNQKGRSRMDRPWVWSEGSIFPLNVPPTNRPRPPGQRVDHTSEIIVAGRRGKHANRCPQAYPPNSDSIPGNPPNRPQINAG